MAGILERRSISREKERHRPNALMREITRLCDQFGSVNENSLPVFDAVALDIVMHGMEGVADSRVVLGVRR